MSMTKKKIQLKRFRDICIRHQAGRLISCEDILFGNLIRAEYFIATQRIIDRIKKWNGEIAEAYLLKKWHKWFKNDYIGRFGIEAWRKKHKTSE